jgi:hypothetical protein
VGHISQGDQITLSGLRLACFDFLVRVEVLHCDYGVRPLAPMHAAFLIPDLSGRIVRQDDTVVALEQPFPLVTKTLDYTQIPFARILSANAVYST